MRFGRWRSSAVAFGLVVYPLALAADPFSCPRTTSEMASTENPGPSAPPTAPKFSTGSVPLASAPIGNSGLGEFDRSRIGDQLGKGGRASAYAIPERPDAIMIVRGLPNPINMARSTRIKELGQGVPAGVAYCRVLEVGTLDGRLAEVQERAPGKALHDRKDESPERWERRLVELANAPQAHYDKLLADLRVLQEHGLTVDPSKPDNFFYDPDKGFTIIDAGPRTNDDFDNTRSVEVPLIFTHRLYSSDKVSLAASTAIRTILQKVERTGYPPVNKVEIEEGLQSRAP